MFCFFYHDGHPLNHMSHITDPFFKSSGGHFIWVKYNELTTSSLEIVVSKGNHPQMALIQVSELL